MCIKFLHQLYFTDDFKTNGKYSSTILFIIIGMFVINEFNCSSFDVSCSLVGKSDIPLIMTHSILFALQIYAMAADSVSEMDILFSFNYK